MFGLGILTLTLTHASCQSDLHNFPLFSLLCFAMLQIYYYVDVMLSLNCRVTLWQLYMPRRKMVLWKNLATQKLSWITWILCGFRKSVWISVRDCSAIGVSILLNCLVVQHSGRPHWWSKFLKFIHFFSFQVYDVDTKYHNMSTKVHITSLQWWPYVLFAICSIF